MLPKEMKPLRRRVLSRRVVAALWLCLSVAVSVLLPGTPSAAQAQTAPWTITYVTPSEKNPNSYALWVKHGTLNASGVASGDTVSIWTMDAGGHQIKISPTYGPYPGWEVYELLPAFDGTLRLLWTKPSGTTFATRQTAVSIWTLDVYANQTSIGPTYGPFPNWTAYELFPNPDGTSALYWKKPSFDSNGDPNGHQLSIWRVDSTGKQLSVSPTYGPYIGWYMQEAVPSFNKDGSSFVVWVNPGDYDENGTNYTGNQISVWKTDVQGNQTSVGPTYGRYAGWHFSELYPAYDGTARLLWTKDGTYDDDYNYSGETASVWSMNATGKQTALSPSYGPYAGWKADSLITAPSSTSRLVWIKPGTTNDSGSYSGDLASIWSLNAANVQTSISPTYTLAGGYAGGLSVLPDGSERFEWDLGTGGNSTYDNARLSLWSLDASNNRTATGPIYGPYF